jgi:hypothetical protein
MSFLALEKSLIISEIALNTEPVFRRYYEGVATVAGEKPKNDSKKDDFL